jgi:5'-3' exonuclease
MPGPLLAIDGPFVLYRSFFALPDSITDGDGHPVNALLGAVNLILRIAADRRPRAIVVCFGAEAATYRTDLYPPYHAHRPPVPDALAWQFERAPDLFAAFAWPTMDSDDLEADDLLGSLATAEVDRGGRALIMTGDRDMYQCAGERVSVVYLKQGASGFEEVDPPEVRRRYGIDPELVPDFIALRGDPSDGLPGAPGIGAKTAAELLRAHDTLEQLLKDARSPGGAGAELRPRTRGALLDNESQLLAFKEIATLQEVKLKRPPDTPTDHLGGAQAAEALGMRRLAERLRKLGDGAG